MATAEATYGPGVRSRLSFGRHLGLGAFWLGLYFVITPVYTVLLQVQVAQTVEKGFQNSAVALATFVSGGVALVVPPLVGAWSDHLHSPWGRRRPVMVAGVAGIVLACTLLFAARNYPLVLIGFVLAVATINVASAAYVALIPDTVDQRETGRASGVLGFMVQLGSVTSLLATLAMARAGNIRLTYVVIVIVVLLTLIPSLWAASGRADAPLAPRAGSLGEFLKPLWSGDFGWATLTRFLFVSGLYTVLPFLLFANRDLYHIPKADQFTATFNLTVTAVAIPFAIAGGWISDRYGRKVFCYLAALLQAGVVLVVSTGALPVSLLLVMAVIFGAGYGLFGAVDWALGLDTLPDKDRPAKDLGLFHVADALPRVLMPVPVGLMLDAVNHASPNTGYRVMFVLSGVLYLLGGVLVTRIKRVR